MTTSGPIDAPISELPPDGMATPRPKANKKLMFSLLANNLGVFILWGAIPGLMLASQVESIDPGDKIRLLGLVTTIGSVFALVAQPLAGAISDRTRSRFGRRAPWMVLGALVGGLSIMGLGFSNTIVTITISWCAVQVAYNFLQGPLSAILPDRVPPALRGTFSTVLGIGMMGGMLGGQVYGSQFMHTNASRLTGYLILGGLALTVTTLFVIFNPDKSSKDAVLEPFSVWEFIKGFWVSPIKHPDFFWAFLGRILLMIGFTSIGTFQLFILQDYIGLTKADAGNLVPLLALVNMVGMLLTMSISGPWSDRIGRRKVFVVVSSAILAGGIVVPLFMPTVTGMMIGGAIMGLGYGIYIAVDNALMTEVLPSAESAAKDMGVLNIAATLPQVLSPAIASFVVYTFGGYAPLYMFASLMAILGAIAILPIKSVR